MTPPSWYHQSLYAWWSWGDTCCWSIQKYLMRGSADVYVNNRSMTAGVWLHQTWRINVQDHSDWKLLAHSCSSSNGNMTLSCGGLFSVNALTLLRLQGSKCWYTSQGLSSALKSQTLPNLTRSKYIYRSKLADCFWLVKALSGIVQDGQNDSKNQSKCPCVHICVNSQNRQLTGFDLYSNFQLKVPQ